MYIGSSLYFCDHFCVGTQINNVDYSGKTVDEVRERIINKSKDYELEIVQRNGGKEKISAEEIEYEFVLEDEITDFQENQNPMFWIFKLFQERKYEVETSISYNIKLLKECFDDLSCLDKDYEIDPQDAYAKKVNNKYIIVDAKQGNKVKYGLVKCIIMDAIKNGEMSISLEESQCYEKPKYTLESYEVKRLKDELNKYSNLNIIYQFGDREEILDGRIINSWLTVNKKYEVKIIEKEVEEYVKGLAKKYDTLYKTRKFKNAHDRMVQINGGSYGWKIDVEEETKDLLIDIKKGIDVEKEPKYIQKGISRNKNDIGDSYIEIDLSNQRMWYYEDGKCKVDTSVVTGNIRKGMATPAGTYYIVRKTRNRILRGPGYASFVNYWMPINGGIGIHDANWRGRFGGSIYKSSGSHGCINTPFYKVKEIFERVDVGTPVVCYY